MTGICARMEGSTMYENLSRMSDAKFAAMLVDMVEAAHDQLEGNVVASVEYGRGVVEAVGHQVAVFLAQRYNTSVGTDEAIDLLGIGEPLDPKGKRRMKLARNAMAAFADDRRHAEEGGR